MADRNVIRQRFEFFRSEGRSILDAAIAANEMIGYGILSDHVDGTAVGDEPLSLLIDGSVMCAHVQLFRNSRGLAGLAGKDPATLDAVRLLAEKFGRIMAYASARYPELPEWFRKECGSEEIFRQYAARVADLVDPAVETIAVTSTGNEILALRFNPADHFVIMFRAYMAISAVILGHEATVKIFAERRESLKILREFAEEAAQVEGVELEALGGAPGSSAN